MIRRQVLFSAGFMLVFVLAGGVPVVSGQIDLKGSWEIDESVKDVTCFGDLPDELLRDAEENLKEDFDKVKVSKGGRGNWIRWKLRFDGFKKRVVSKKIRPPRQGERTVTLKSFKHPVHLYGNDFELYIRATVTLEQSKDQLYVEATVTLQEFSNVFECEFYYKKNKTT